MAGKRSATSDLNHENWDQEEESEDSGHFQTAPPEVLQSRIIKSAKRRTIGQSGDEVNVFSGFTGFSKRSPTTSTKTTSNLFNFLSKPASDKSPIGMSNGTNTNSLSKPNNSMKSETETKDNKSTEYYSKLKGLNESVSQWIKTHVDSNPICILTPIFKDYEKYLKEIEELSPTKVSEISKSAEKFETVPKFSPSSILSIDNNFKQKAETKSTFEINRKDTESKSGNVSSEKQSSSIVNVQKNDNESVSKSFVTPFSNTAAFSFANTPLSSSSGFSFVSGSKPFTFANVSTTSSTNQDKSEDVEETDEPPKVEFVPVVEDGSIYSVRCKLFVKKDSEFVERGVGQLYLKPVEGSEKTQLIVRADTNLGNLLMNVILSKSIPLSRKGKNNLMIVCVPTPEEASKTKQDEDGNKKPPLQTMLIKVKTTEEADKLMEMLEKHKN